MNKIKVLIVEDEPVVALELKAEVEKLQCKVTATAHTQNKVLSSIEQNEPDIILMDINLGKGQDGVEIVKQIQKTKKIPILYITAYSDDETMKRAFDTDPIGYIVKPFKPQDIRTNLQLAIYKLNLNEQTIINKDFHYLGEGFYFDMNENNLYYKDNFIKLGSKEKHLLSILINANYSKVKFEDLEYAIWNGHHTSISSLRTLVYRLKGKLGNNIIQVMYGYGYYLKKPLP